MNKRIKELFEQAHIQPPATRSGQFAFTPPKTFSPEKFAELIVQDNIRTLRSNGYDDAAQCLQDIHFGIEDPI
jgi:hypothetical protein